MSNTNRSDADGSVASRTRGQTRMRARGEEGEGAQAIDPSPAMRIYRDALHSIFAMLRLSDLVAVLATSRSWHAAASDVPPIHGALLRVTPLTLRRVLGSKLRRHIRQIGDKDSLLVKSQDLSLMFAAVPRLTQLSVSITLDSALVSIVLPPHLRDLTLVFPVPIDYQMSAQDVAQLHVFFKALANASELESLYCILPYKSPLLDLTPLKNLRLQRRVVEYHVHDAYGRFIMDGPPDPIPPFPCAACATHPPICAAHKNVLYIKTMTGSSFTIPWPSWNCWRWIKLRVEEACGIPVNEQRLIFAGAERPDFSRHSGLQYGSTIHLVQKPPPSPTEWNDHDR